jgi:uncharacterized membrane protein YtjA (UPF0391 family)
MLKRAFISAVIASLAAIFGFSGLLDGAAPIAKVISYALGAFSVVSLLFSLFEDAPEPVLQEPQTATEPQLVFSFAAERPVLLPAHV